MNLDEYVAHTTTTFLDNDADADADDDDDNGRINNDASFDERIKLATTKTKRNHFIIYPMQEAMK